MKKISAKKKTGEKTLKKAAKKSERKKRVNESVPRKKELLDFIKTAKSPRNIKDVLERFKLSKSHRMAVKRVLREMAVSGDIQKVRNKYMLPDTGGSVSGIIQVKKDFGFLLNDRGDDVFLGKNTVRNLLDGDEIDVYVKRSFKGGMEGVLKKVISRVKTPVMCRVKKFGPFFHGYPAGRDEPAIKLDPGGYILEHGDIVLVKVEEGAGELRGNVISRLEGTDNKEVLKKFILEANDIHGEFSSEVLDEAEKIKTDKSGISGRYDMREETVITIDPFDAKDYDDAVSLEKKDGIYNLGVHIADVTAFLKENTKMDAEAYARGLSTYLPAEVIPMLPEKLSNNICSLVEGEDRLVFSVFMKINGKGEVESYEIKESVIRNSFRMTYEQAQEVIKGNKKDCPEKISGMLVLMDELKNILRKNLIAGGMIDFSLGEPVLILSGDNEVIDVKRKEGLDSYKLVEYFMIYANICAADFIAEKGTRGMFRTHPKPDSKDLDDFNRFAAALGMDVYFEKGTNREFQKIFETIKAHKMRYFAEKRLLRAMQLAKYSEKNPSHFGLGLERYTHFTSPIRRYADVIVHRIIKRYLGIEGYALNADKLREAAMHISSREAKSEKAENDIFRLYVLFFLRDRLGETADIFISRLTKNGMVVEFLDYPVDGFISFESLGDDYYIFDEERQMISGKRTKKIFRLGDRISAIIVSIKPETLKIELEISG
ncbi:MAG TPA: VacB/RNase II family 3'-5' exoribonuclease [Firmicutes bacterium]|nr:VacB/RNase II family 3'-5' exoribonuclease [Bacillota bacterium]